MLEDVFIPHSKKQDDLIFSDASETYAITGTQWGKSMSASLWIKRQTHTFIDKQDNFILAAPTYKIMNQSMLPYFLQVMNGLGRYNKADGVFEMYSGGTIYLRTGTDPDSIVGIPRVRAFWGDECGLFSLYFSENVRARIAAHGGRILYTTSPYSLNWLWKDVIKPYKKGLLKDVKIISAASWENPYHGLHDPLRREAEMARMDPRRFAMIYGGEFGKMQGLVYDCWDDEINIIDPIEFPAGTKFYGGIDWGYTDPFVFKIRAVTPTGQQYGISEFYKTGMTVSDMCRIVGQKHQVFKLQTVFCDPSRPEHIEEMNRHGIPAIASNNDIRRGIDAHYELIKTGKYKEFKGACPNTMDEIQTYHYPEPKDLGPDQDSEEQLPVDAGNHCLDCDRYITMGTLFLNREKKVIMPKSDDPFAGIYKKKSKHSEEWI